jgi:cytochrome c-type biogenesis protein CcmH
MPAFIAIAAVLALATLALALAPLWRTQRGLAAGLSVFVAGAAIGLYALLGTPAALDPSLREAPQTVDAAIERLQQELQRNPAQPDGWRLLGRVFAEQGKSAESRDAYARAATLRPDDPDVLAEAAEARAKAAPQHRFDAQAVQMLEHALQRDPKHQRSRWFPASPNARPATPPAPRRRGNRCSPKSMPAPSPRCDRRSMRRARMPGCRPCLRLPRSRAR